MPLRHSVAILLAASCLIAGQDLSSLPECGQTCFKNLMEGGASALGCASNVVSCLCAKPDFRFGIDDCATQNCGAAVAPTVTNYLTALCATATLATAVTPPTTSSPPPPPGSTSAISDVPLTTSSTDSGTTAPTSSTEESVATPPPASPASIAPGSTQTSEPTVTGEASTPTSSRSQTATSSSSTTLSSNSSNASSVANTSASSSASNLSMGAIVGISVGGAAVILAAVILAMIRRHHVQTHKRRSADNLGRLKISEPMPGGGRTYAGLHSSTRQLGTSDLEMRSRRYEDMVPRMAPRLVS